MPPADALPADFRLTLDAGVRRIDDGAVLVGGSPLRILRLSPRGARLLDRWGAGQPVGAAPPHRKLARRLLDAGMAHPVPGPSPYGLKDVSLVVPVRDRPGQLARLLATVHGHSAREVLVIDDGSRQATPGAAARHPVPRGPAAARNTGWRLATGDVVAFLDSDCDPTPGWLEPLLRHFADPHVAAVAPRIQAPPGPTALQRFEHHRAPHDLGGTPGPVRPRTRIGYVPTAALLVRRSALQELGGFDEALRYGEDIDLVWRLAGRYTVRYEPAAVVHHPARPGLGAWLYQRFGYGTAAAPLARRHPGNLAPLGISPWSLAAWVLVAAGHPRAAGALAAATTARMPRRLRSLQRPVPEALRLAGLGHLNAWRPLSAAIIRTWWPLALAAAVPSRRARRTLAVAATVPYLTEWVSRRPALDPVRWTALSLADDLAYGAGVWTGCLRERTLGPLLPTRSRE